jgi:uncharacterized protein YndB with AHSA1/START domain
LVEQKNTLDVTFPSERELTMTRVLDAPRGLVFAAFTEPEHLVRWFGSRENKLAVCEVDLRVGGQARFLWRFADGSEMGITDTYREIAAPDRIVYTERFDEPYAEVMGGETVNTLVLTESDGKTTMSITTLYASQEARDGAIATGMEDGASESFDLLAELLDELVRARAGTPG